MKNQLIHGNLLTVAAFVLVFCADVRAEIISKVPGDFGWRKSLPLHLILSTQVVADLGLSSDVSLKLKTLHKQIQREVEAERAKPHQEAPKAPKVEPWVRRYEWNDAILHSVRNRHTDELNQLLTNEQQERLYQIHLQRQRKPTDVLCDPEVAKALSLNGSQRAAIYQRHYEVVRAEMNEVKMGREYKGPSSATLEDACPELVMKILTEEQRQSFQKLRGRPLK